MASSQKFFCKADKAHQAGGHSPNKKKANAASCSLLSNEVPLYQDDKDLDNSKPNPSTAHSPHLRRVDSAVNVGPRPPHYDVLEHFDRVDQMMADARAAEAAAKLPPVEPPPPPPDYDTTEYFAKLDRMMAKIADGTIEDEEDEVTKHLHLHAATKAIASSIKSAYGSLMKTTRSFLGCSRSHVSSEDTACANDKRLACLASNDEDPPLSKKS